MNTIYRKTSIKEQKIKEFKSGQLDKALLYGWDLARRKNKMKLFLVTEDKRVLKLKNR